MKAIWMNTALLCLCACGAEELPASESPLGSANQPVWFEELAQARGLVFEHVSGHAEKYYMPEIMGGGAALFDMDGDGDLDAYLVQSGSLLSSDPRLSNKLFENLGAGHFRDVSEGSGAADAGYGNGVACADVDGDGDVDLYVTNVGPNVLLLNEGGGRFRDATLAAGVGDAGWGTSATFFDADRDGRLDLFVANYLDWSISSELKCEDTLGRADYCSPKGYETPGRDVFYRNLGGGRFADESTPSGIGSLRGTGLGVVAADFNADGFSDVFVANDGMEDHLWIGRGDGSFENQARRWGCATDINGLKKAGMGVTAEDIDGDLDMDLLVCNLAGETDSMYQNQGSYFTDASPRSGLGQQSRSFTRFGQGWLDFDLDGDFDLFQGNGRVARSLESLQAADPYAEPNLLLAGDGQGRFSEVLPRGGTRELFSYATRAVAFGDVDNDGAPDILLVHRDAPAQLLLNRAALGRHWLLLDVREKSGAPAIGAELVLSQGERRQRRDVRAGYSYQASNDPRAHFGLGEKNTPARVEVRWSDGVLASYGPLEPDQIHVLQRSE